MMRLLALLLLLCPSLAVASTVSIVGTDFHLNGTVTYPGAPAQGKLMNVRMTNATFEDDGGPQTGFNAAANTNEFLAAMSSYIASGVRAFTLNLQGGNPGYEGAVNSAFNSNGTLKAAYLDRVELVIREADAQGAAIILGLFYQRQDQILTNQAAVEAGVVNVCAWIASEGFSNVLLEIANEYPHSGYAHGGIQSDSGQVNLIGLAKANCPSTVKVSTSGLGDGQMAASVAAAADYLIIHFNDVANPNDYAALIAALQSHGKPIVVNEDPKEGSPGAAAAQAAVTGGASWGYFKRSNQDFPFVFNGTSEDSAVYTMMQQLTTGGGVPAAPSGLTVTP